MSQGSDQLQAAGPSSEIRFSQLKTRRECEDLLHQLGRLAYQDARLSEDIRRERYDRITQLGEYLLGPGFELEILT